MNALILGKNEINGSVAEVLSINGVDTVTVEDAADILKFRGEPGAFSATTRDGEYGFASVIITEPPSAGALMADGGATISLMDDEGTKRLFEPKNSEKIVILLDYAGETPEYMAAKAIALAKRLADRKKGVVFLSKVIKSGYCGGEQAWRDARNAGVVFIKYEAASLGYDEEADRFAVEADDGVFSVSIDTPYVVTDNAGAMKGPAAGPESALKKLRLYKRADGLINDDRFFMYPALSARRGIYYLGPALAMQDKQQSVKQAMLAIIGDMKTVGADGYEREIIKGWDFPEIDAGKCAFCYSCYRACPHGALEPDTEASAMKVIEASCQACGTCIAICPGEAIARKSGEGSQAGDEAIARKSGEGSQAGDEAIARKSGESSRAGGGRLKAYCCENGAADAFESVLPSLANGGRDIDCERVACGGSVGADILAGGLAVYDTLIVACCMEDACRHMDGDKRACKQAKRAAELLEKASLGWKRVFVIKASHAMAGVLKDDIEKILEGDN